MTSNSSRFRIQFAFGALACVALMGYALYAQYELHLEPCPLCIFQRIAVCALGLVFLMGALAGPKSVGGKRTWSVIAVLMALAGIAVAARHLWLQSLPPHLVPACGPGLGYMWDAMPFGRLIAKVFSGSGECAAIPWRFLGLSMPGWVLGCFVALAGWALVAGFRRRP